MTASTNTPRLRQHGQQWLSQALIEHISPQTIKNRRVRFNKFATWCEELGVTDAAEVTTQLLESYRRHLFHARQKRNDRPLGIEYQSSCLRVVKQFFDWLCETEKLSVDPAVKLKLPRPSQRLPSNHLTQLQAESVFAEIDTSTPIGVRDRAVLETFYASGIRRSELVRLSLYDLNRENRLLTIRYGKGRKERIVPVSQRAIDWIDKYLSDVRPQLADLYDPNDRVGRRRVIRMEDAVEVKVSAEEALFLGSRGAPLHPVSVSRHVKDYMLAAGINRRGSCHTFRHTAATLMLENGADIRSLQTFLGHAKLSTTELYTHVTLKHLRQVHDKTHPANHDPRSLRQTTDDQASES